MNRLVAVMLAGVAVALIGIVSWMPLVVAVGTLGACAALLVALLNYVATIQE